MRHVTQPILQNVLMDVSQPDNIGAQPSMAAHGGTDITLRSSVAGDSAEGDGKHLKMDDVFKRVREVAATHIALAELAGIAVRPLTTGFPGGVTEYYYYTEGIIDVPDVRAALSAQATKLQGMHVDDAHFRMFSELVDAHLARLEPEQERGGPAG